MRGRLVSAAKEVVINLFTKVSSCRPYLRGGEEWAHD